MTPQRCLTASGGKIVVIDVMDVLRSVTSVITQNSKDTSPEGNVQRGLLVLAARPGWLQLAAPPPTRAMRRADGSKELVHGLVGNLHSDNEEKPVCAPSTVSQSRITTVDDSNDLPRKVLSGSIARRQDPPWLLFSLTEPAL